MICFNWLHLTDLHRGMKEHQWLWPGVREIFFNDLQVLHEKCGPWDLVLFTGDLTQCGSLEEFHKVNNLFEQLWEYFDRLGSNPRLVVIPGNHDLVRPQKKTAAIRMLIQWNDYPDIQDEFWENEDSEYRQVVTQAFEPYTAWWNRQPFRAENINPGILPGDCSVTFEKEGVTLGIVGLNTSFLQLTEGNYDDKLALHTRQFHAVCGGDGLTWVKQHHTCLLLTHHPPVWLNSNSRQHLDGEIVAHGRFAVHLCGHMHETAYREIAEGGTEARRIWQGRSLFGLEYFGKENEDQRFHGYTAGRIELSENTGSLLFWPREARLQGRQRNIIPDHSILLTDNQHTHPKKFELLQPYIKGKPSTEQAEEQEKSLPFVIFAMTRKEAVDLFLPRSSMASKDEQAHYRRLKEILKDYNLENITRFYGETRENWCPPIAEEGETIQNAVENIVQQVNYRLGRDIPKIRPIFLSKEFLSDKKKEDRQIRRQLNKNGYILVISKHN
jgi:predicted phosphohydrolase